MHLLTEMRILIINLTKLVLSQKIVNMHICFQHHSENKYYFHYEEQCEI